MFDWPTAITIYIIIYYPLLNQAKELYIDLLTIPEQSSPSQLPRSAVPSGRLIGRSGGADVPPPCLAATKELQPAPAMNLS